ncbi:MAG: hypothetical protein CVU05_10190 [Bacteroidetes bacterium HGW-Bacteroidetes-21]|jgi:hypothetical protein|nr:MAG: hypothetical protein CVU05_10190 [Bacteroidetes bacterium HGW-Bacteroidetes-21]
MKIFLILIYLIPIVAISQNISVLTTKTNVLYIRINNPVKIFLCNFPCDKVTLICENTGVEVSGENCDYKIKPSFIGTIKFKVVNKYDSTIIDTFSLKSVQTPDPVFKFHLSGHADLKMDYIIAENPVWDNLGIEYKITKFELLAKRDTTVLFDEINEGSSYSKHLIQRIGELKKQDKLYILHVWLEIEGKLIGYPGNTYHMFF